MRKQKGFTLVELLTVISIIAILLAISLSMLNSVRRKARAVVCISNLRQWGMVYKMYTDEFDGKLPRDYGKSPWYYPISNYYRNNREILLCPSAKKPSSQDGPFEQSQYGGTLAAWKFFSPLPDETVWNSIGSYGLSGWAYKFEKTLFDEDMNDIDGKESEPESFGSMPPSSGEDWWNYWKMRSKDIEDINEISKPEKYWLIAYQNVNNIPMVFDCSWLYSSFDDNTEPPSSKDSSGHSNTACIDRHNGGINMLFMDFSTRKVGLKELWTLKWHKQFNTSGRWTNAGGVLPEEWPKWMQKYKDY